MLAASLSGRHVSRAARAPASRLGIAAFGRTGHEPQRAVAAAGVCAAPARRFPFRLRYSAVEGDHQRDEAARVADGPIDDGGLEESSGCQRARLLEVAADR